MLRYDGAMEPLVTEPEISPLRGAVVVKALACFWTAFVLLNTLRVAILGYPEFIGALERRVVVGLVGAALSWLIYRILVWLRPTTLRTGIAWTTATSLPAALIFSTANFLAFNLLTPLPGGTCRQGQPCDAQDLLVAVSDMQINWTFVFLAWGLLYLALASAAATRASDLRSNADRDAARAAQIMALRYQVNPHFLFNVLNSLATLMGRGQSSEAEEMISEIGDFLRYSLSSEWAVDTTLIDEVEMQQRYLGLEQRRFPDRLAVVVEIAAEVERVAVPPLILQPLVENAIKHGVGRTTSPVRLAIRAFRSADDLVMIQIEDDAPFPDDPSSEGFASGSAPDGFGIGLRNVAERLAARYGSGATLTATRMASRGFRVALVVPLSKA